jgi:hypothetical protein
VKKYTDRIYAFGIYIAVVLISEGAEIEDQALT